MKRVFRKLFPSLFPATEYVASSAGELPVMLDCEAISENKRTTFENQPLFLGYKPLVMAVCDTEEHLKSITASSTVTFRYINKKNGKEVAVLKLKVDKVIPLENKVLVLFTGISGNQKLETPGNKFGFWLRERLIRKSSANIDLTPSEYDQLKIAYSIPREIKILNVFKGETGNIFPIDLFGYAGEKHFVLSLRTEKKSSHQLEESDKIIAWTVRAASAMSTYSLGKNHSADFGRPVLPVNPLGNDEFQLEARIGTYGVHGIYLLKITDSIRGKDEEAEKLVHVHRSYANWHKRHGFPVKEITR